jgi:ubiquinone/menaquinone biosynthesis C-methylase UbiE
MNRKRYVKQRTFFDGQYQDGSYQNKWHKSAPTHELVTLIATGVVPMGRSLDLGCGGGVEVAYLAGQGFAAHGLDFSPTALRLSQEHAGSAGVHAEFCAGSALELPYASGSFALVTDRGCLHHIRDKHRKRYAREVARVTRPGGYVVIRGMAEQRPNGFVWLDPERIEELFSPSFELRPFQLLKRGDGEGSYPDMLLAIMRRKEH